MARFSIDGPVSEQVQAVFEVVGETLGDAVVAVYLYGSAVTGGLRPASDLDLFAVTSRPTRHTERRELVDLLTPISRRGRRPADWRPVELTIVAAPDLTPWGYPPRTDFQYGEWLRDRFDSGEVEPEHPDNPDLALQIEMVRRTGVALHGPAARDLLPEVPASDLRAALVGVVPDLMPDIETDTTNVLLTLARIWHTLETTEFTSKDAAADWAITRLDSAEAAPLAKARDVYLGSSEDGWTTAIEQARSTARVLEDHIRQRADHCIQSARMSSRFRGGQIYGIEIPTVFDENNSIRCEGCGEPISGTPFRISLLDIVAPESPPSWAVGARLNPGPHQFHAEPDHFRSWAQRRGHFFCRLSDVREIMRPVPLPGANARWGLCDGLHREAHEFVPA